MLSLDEYFKKVCEGDYGMSKEAMLPYLSGEYITRGGTDGSMAEVLVLWRQKNVGRLSSLVRDIILPDSLSAYIKENDVDIHLTDAEVAIGHIALTSSELSHDDILGIVQPPMTLMPHRRNQENIS